MTTLLFHGRKFFQAGRAERNLLKELEDILNLIYNDKKEKRPITANLRKNG